MITVTGSGTSLIIAPTDGSLLVHIGGLSVQGGAIADVSAVAARSHTNHRVLVIGKVNQATAPTFSISSTSKLNLESNDMIVHGGNDGTSDLAAVQAAAAVGRNVAPGGIFNGTWTGNGLTSSTAAAVAASSTTRSTTSPAPTTSFRTPAMTITKPSNSLSATTSAKLIC